MIRILRAFARLRWRLFVNGLRGRRRDSMEQVSRISRLFVMAIVGVSLVPMAVVLAVLAFAGASGMARGSIPAGALLAGARVVLGIATLVVGMVPLLRFGGSATSTTRLALLPIPRGLLFATQVTAQATDPWIVAVVPALLAIPAGFLAGRAPAAAAWSLVAAVLMVALLTALGSAVALLAALLFRNRRVGEIVTVAVFVAITVFAYAPMMLRSSFLARHHGARASAGAGAGAGAGAAELVVEDAPSVTTPHSFRFLPSELYVASVRRAASPNSPSPAVPLAGLAALGALLSGAAFLAFTRLLDAPADRRARGSRAKVRIPRLPGLPPAASAVAVATFRLLSRSVRGRLILFTSPLPVLMMGFLWRKGELGIPEGARGLGGPALFAIGGFFALLSIGQILANQFAVDRAGLTLSFLSPARDLDLVLGKAAGAALAGTIPAAASLAIALVLQPGGPPFLWLAACASLAAGYAVQFPVAAFLAAVFPAPQDLMKVRSGNPHSLASLVTMAVTLVVFGAVGGGVATVYEVTRSGALAWGAATLALLVACGAAVLLLPAAGRTLHARRENLAMVAQGR